MVKVSAYNQNVYALMALLLLITIKQIILFIVIIVKPIRFIPLILEFFFPSIGLFYLGRIFHGLVKLILGISSFVFRASGEQNLNAFKVIIMLAFVFLYFVDLIRLLLGKMTDGNGVPVL